LNDLDPAHLEWGIVATPFTPGSTWLDVLARHDQVALERLVLIRPCTQLIIAIPEQKRPAIPRKEDCRRICTHYHSLGIVLQWPWGGGRLRRTPLKHGYIEAEEVAIGRPHGEDKPIRLHRACPTGAGRRQIDLI